MTNTNEFAVVLINAFLYRLFDKIERNNCLVFDKIERNKPYFYDKTERKTFFILLLFKVHKLVNHIFLRLLLILDKRQ